MDLQRIQHHGAALYQALAKREAIAPLTSQDPDITIDDAYRIQLCMIEHRIAATGERIVGKKIGVTSRAVMDMLGVYQPDFGHLLSGMIVSDSESIDTKTLIQPRAEGEIAFILKKDLMGPGVTNAQVLAATECVMPCFEIVDSRIQDWRIKIQDTVADNASCGVFVLGNRAVDPRHIDLTTCGMVLEKNGEVVAVGAGASVLGHPAAAIAMLVNKLAERGEAMPAGTLVMTGGITEAVAVAAGDHVTLKVQGMGSVSIRFA
jgi:2-oxopent-4-enoate/cis-2-oxohex-4-enoate hydratase